MRPYPGRQTTEELVATQVLSDYHILAVSVHGQAPLAKVPPPVPPQVEHAPVSVFKTVHPGIVIH